MMLRQLCEFLISPSDALHDKPEVMRRARAVSALLLAHASMILINIVIMFSKGSIVESSDRRVAILMGTNYCIVSLAYLLSRTRHILPATHLACMVMIVSVFYGATLDQHSLAIYASLPWLVAPILLIAFISSSPLQVGVVIVSCIACLVSFAWPENGANLTAYILAGLPVIASSCLILIGAAIQAQDIHQLQEANQRALASKRLLHSIMDNSSALVYAKDREGRYIAMNQQLRNLFDLTLEGVKGRLDREIFPPLCAEIFAKNDERVIASASPFTYEEALHVGTESRAFLHQKFPLFDADGLIFAVACIATDITALQQAEQQIKAQQAQLLASAKLSALGQMAAGLAHEINNPLSIIYSNARHLTQYLADTPPRKEEARAAATIITDTVKRISSIIKGLRTLSHHEPYSEFKNEDLNSMLEDALSFCRERFRNHGIRLIIAGARAEVLVSCNRVQIAQVLLNLLNNAFDAVKNQEQPWIRVSAFDFPSEIEIVVEDSGSGISDDLHRKIFQPFFTTKPVGQGTGLGLPVSRDIIEHHHGKLIVDTESRNTRFIVILPKQGSTQIRSSYLESA